MVPDASEGRPNFLVIGAAKSGTTALWHQLRQHPQIYMSPRKHTRHFAYEVEDPGFCGPASKRPSVPYAVADADAYRALFAGVEDEAAVGEASHSYLYQPAAPERIRRYASGMKLIAMLRQPAERAFSHYNQMIRDGREPLENFGRALEAEEARVRKNWWPDFHYARMGLYHVQLQRYFGLFDRRQIKVYLYDDFQADPLGVLRDAFEFLDVDATFGPQAMIKYNASGRPKSRFVYQALQKLRSAKPLAERALPGRYYRSLLRAGGHLHNRNLSKARLSSRVRRQITDDLFEEDIVKLQELIGRDLSGWLT